MSTNFYLKCRCCGQEIYHLGKISNNEFLSNFTQQELFKKIDMLGHWEIIYDEYGKPYSSEEFLKRITMNFVLMKGVFC